MVLTDPNRHPAFEKSLEASLTPAITKYLPLSMQYPGDYADISGWISDRTNEAHVLTVHLKSTTEFAGLIMLHASLDEDGIPALYIGYFYDQAFWGAGYATEALGEVVAALEAGPKTRLFAGVDVENTASSGVLGKLGFKRIAEQSTAGRHFFERMSS